MNLIFMEMSLAGANHEIKQRMRDNPNLKILPGTEHLPVPLIYDSSEVIDEQNNLTGLA